MHGPHKKKDRRPFNFRLQSVLRFDCEFTATDQCVLKVWIRTVTLLLLSHSPPVSLLRSCKQSISTWKPPWWRQTPSKWIPAEGLTWMSDVRSSSSTAPSSPLPSHMALLIDEPYSVVHIWQIDYFAELKHVPGITYIYCQRMRKWGQRSGAFIDAIWGKSFIGSVIIWGQRWCWFVLWPVYVNRI